MAGTLRTLAGPVALSATLTTNIYNPSSAIIYGVIKQIHVVNKDSVARTFSLWIGGTGGNVAGTEFFNAESVPANTAKEYFLAPGKVMKSTDFLVGGASAATTLTITVMGEENVTP
jgi:hypothetical protein